MRVRHLRAFSSGSIPWGEPAIPEPMWETTSRTSTFVSLSPLKIGTKASHPSQGRRNVMTLRVFATKR